jgi:hypothetical protein
MRLILAFGLAFALAACGTDSEYTRQRDRVEQAVTTYPPNYKSEIVAFMRTYLNDPTGVRDAYVSEPTLRALDGMSRYSVCVRYNAKSGGQYAGPKDALVLFRDGRLDRFIDARLGPGPDMAREQCKTAAYVPFPELGRLSR